MFLMLFVSFMGNIDHDLARRQFFQNQTDGSLRGFTCPRTYQQEAFRSNSPGELKEERNPRLTGMRLRSDPS